MLSCRREDIKRRGPSGSCFHPPAGGILDRQIERDSQCLVCTFLLQINQMLSGFVIVNMSDYIVCYWGDISFTVGVVVSSSHLRSTCQT